MAAPVVKINVVVRHSLAPDDGRRRWVVDVRQTLPTESELHPVEGTVVVDPATTKTYVIYENELRGGGAALPIEPSHVSPPQLHEHSSSGLILDNHATDDVSTSIMVTDGSDRNLDTTQYRSILHDSVVLLADPPDKTVIKVSISEDLEPREDGHYCSIHSLLWELLEHDFVSPLVQKNRQAKVQVKRWITGIKDAGQMPVSLRCPKTPIRLLLIVARSLRQSSSGRFLDGSSVVHDTLYALVKYLRRQGQHNRLVFHVVRPGTLAELEQHLKRESKYDIVHLDVHGWVDRRENPEKPELLFAKPDIYNPEPEKTLRLDKATFAYTHVEEVAELLKTNGVKAVALSACLSSYSQGRSPLSNMCRVFASHGVAAVTGMSFTVLALTAQAYYAGFYPALVLANQGFHGAAIHARRTLQDRENKLWEKQANVRNTEQPQSWPTATTFFATNKLDRVDSGERAYMMGHLSPAPPTLSAVITDKLARWRLPWPFLFVLPVTSASACSKKAGFITFTVLAAVNLFSMAARWRVDDLSGFEGFMKDRNNLAVKHSVGLMALEDRLRNLGRLFIQISPPRDRNTRKECLHALKDLWLTTGFADTIEVVSASRFKHERPYWLTIRRLRDKLLSTYANLKSWWGGLDLPAEPRANQALQSPRTILIIYEFDSIVKYGEELYPSALSRMDQYIGEVTDRDPSGILLIIMSHADVDWLNPAWDVNKFKWTVAQLFHTETNFVTFSTSE